MTALGRGDHAAARFRRRDNDVGEGPLKQCVGDAERDEFGFRARGCQHDLGAGDGENDR